MASDASVQIRKKMFLIHSTRLMATTQAMGLASFLLLNWQVVEQHYQSAVMPTC